LQSYVAAHPELAPTPLLKSKELGRALGLKSLLMKDETARFDLPAFKVLGAGFAVAQLLERGSIVRGDLLVCASEGNHGRAVARVARQHGLRARVYVGARVADSRADAIALEGAEVVRVDGTYDDAVRRAAADGVTPGTHIISDTAWPGYDEIPRLIMLGYTRLMDEAAAQWKSKAPDLVVVQGGVGGLAAAVSSWYAANPAVPRATLVCVEPYHAACLMESARAGQAVAIPGSLDTIMGGLRCGEASPAALPAVLEGYDAYLAIDDVWTRRAMLRLARPTGGERPIASGASGAAGLAALMALASDPTFGPVREALGIGERTRAMVIVTEGVTEPELYEEVVGGGGRARQR
jgi:diaminopropionate ammonia-lyase